MGNHREYFPLPPPPPPPPHLPFVQTEPRRAEKLFWRPDQTDDLNLQLNLGRPK